MKFNEKWKYFLEPNHYGFDIYLDSPELIDYLDNIMGELSKIPGFKYKQIKLKFGYARFYTNLYDVLGPNLGHYIESKIESKINEILKNKTQ